MGLLQEPRCRQKAGPGCGSTGTAPLSACSRWGRVPGAASFADFMGVNTWRRGWSKLLAFPSWAQEPASAGFHASGFVRTHAGLRDLQANDGTHPPPWKRAQTTGQQWWSLLACTPNGRWHHRTAFTSKTAFGEKMQSLLSQREPSRPVHLTAQLKTA